MTRGLFLALVLASSPSFAAPGLTLRPLLGLFDPGGSTGESPQRSAAVTIGTTIPLGSSFAFRAAYTRRWVDGLSPLGFDRLEALNEAARTLSLRLTGTLTTSATFIYSFFVRDVKARAVLCRTPHRSALLSA